MRSLLIAVLAAASFGVSSSVIAQVPGSLGFQGFLTRSDGSPLDSSTVSMTFNLYKNGSSVWSETQVVDVDSGNYNVYLGAVTPLDTVAFNEPIDLGIKLDGEASEMSPRTPLVAGAFALGMRGLSSVWAVDGLVAGFNIVGGASHNSVGPGAVGATISGGGGFGKGLPKPNEVTSDWGTVGGGKTNRALGANWSTVGGGSGNTAEGDAATVAGGSGNRAVGSGAVVGGGTSNQATADHATIGGGNLNVASGGKSTIGGGAQNTASGEFASIVGGLFNKADGIGSFAAGISAEANHKGSFVWQDSTGRFNGALSTTAPNQFLARASGGFFLYTGAAPDLTTGISLPAGSGTWSALSSKASKTNFRQVDSRDYLDRVASLELTEWSYKTEGSVTHVGPMAEDFYAAFGHGPGERSISTVDSDGVALAAIQGLYELVLEQQTLLAKLQTEIEYLRAESK